MVSKNARKLLIIAFTAVLSIILILLCACDLGHTHEYTTRVIDPTCTEEGYTLYTCLCGDEKKDHYTDALGHNYSTEFFVDKTPTCEETGVKSNHCLNGCGSVDNVTVIDATGHNFLTNFTIDIEPTCLSAGSKSKHCLNNCGAVIENTEIPALGHNFLTDFTVDIVATCETAGQKSKHCLNGCGSKDEITDIPALGHFINHHEAKEATCTEIGWNEYDDCSRCEYSTYVEINAIGHHASDWVVDVEATCDSEGSKHTECIRCQIVFETSVIEALEHDWTYTFNDKEHCVTCNLCKSSQRSAHDWNDNDCLTCGYDAGGLKGLLWKLDDDDSYIVAGIGSVKDDDIEIPSTHNGKPVMSIGVGAFQNCLDLRNVIISDSIVKIDDNAFYCCESLTRVTIGKGITTMGGNAFGDCSSLESVYYEGEVSDWCNICFESLGANPLNKGANLYLDNAQITELIIPDSVTEIKNFAFNNCISMVNLTIGNGVTKIGEWAFSKCCNLSSVLLGDSVTIIGFSAFSDCSNLTDIIIPDSVTTISWSAFSNCSSLTSATIGNGVTTIRGAAFFNCGNLESVTIGRNVTSIEEVAFSACSNLTSVYYTGSVDEWCNITFGNYNANPLYYAHNLYIGNELVRDLEIPTTVTEVKNQFVGISAISITIPDSVDTICDYAFSGCSNLESITLPFIGGSRLDSNDDYQYPFGYIFGTNSYAGATLTIQGYYGSSVSSGEYSPYYIPSNLTSVTITGGNIRYGSFCNCSNLTSIKLPDSITFIGDYAFSGCSSLSSITIPDSVITVGIDAFKDCNNIEVASIPAVAIPSIPKKNLITAVVTSGDRIGDCAFQNCSKLTSITLDNTVKFIGSFAFNRCESLSSVYYMGDVVDWCSIEFGDNSANPLHSAHNLYINNKLVTELEIPNTITEIKYSAFYGCTSITRLTMPESVVSIGFSAFDGCTSLTNIYYAGNLASWCEIDGLGSLLTSARSLYINNEEIIGELVIPDTVTQIKSYAFVGRNITSVLISDKVERIDYWAFSNCDNLETVYWNATACTNTGFGNNIFDNCAKLTTVVIGSNVAEISDCAFKSCSNLETVYWNATECETAGSYWNPNFAECPRLTTVIIGENVKSLPNYAFARCSGLKNVIIPDGVTKISSFSFLECRGLTSLTIGKGITAIGSAAFADCSNLETVYWNAIDCQSAFLGSAAIFRDCPKFTTLIIGNNVTTLTAYAFVSCGGLKSVTIPDSVVTIGVFAFQDCTGLTNVEIGEGVNLIGVRAFYNCSGLTSITIPNSVTTIGEAAFYNCSSLESVTIGDGVTSIEEDAFSGCSSLTSVTIPDSVTTIGNSAFNGCSSIETVYWNATACASAGSSGYSIFYGCIRITTVVIGDNVTTMPSYAFGGCSNLTSVIIPNSVKSIGEYAFNCGGLNVYYTGTANDWAKISIDNSNTIFYDTLYYYSESEPQLNDDGTAYDGNYWYYGEEGEIVVWTKN